MIPLDMLAVPWFNDDMNDTTTRPLRWSRDRWGHFTTLNGAVLKVYSVNDYPGARAKKQYNWQAIRNGVELTGIAWSFVDAKSFAATAARKLTAS